MAAQILETKAYGMFKLHGCNRDIKRIARLEDSMSKYGWLDAYPAHVVKDSNGLQVKAGHHRITAAAKLGIPVKYVVCEDGGVSIFELEQASTPWVLKDYLDAYCRKGLPDYLVVKKYCDGNLIPPNMAIALLSDSPGATHVAQAFKRGEFKIKTLDLIESVVSVLETMKLYGAHGVPTTNLIKALGRCVCVKEFDVVRFKKKIKSFPQLLVKQISVKGYLLNIEQVYNRQTSDKIQLLFLAEKEAERRLKKVQTENMLAARAKRARVANIHAAVVEASQY